MTLVVEGSGLVHVHICMWKSAVRVMCHLYHTQQYVFWIWLCTTLATLGTVRFLQCTDFNSKYLTESTDPGFSRSVTFSVSSSRHDIPHLVNYPFFDGRVSAHNVSLDYLDVPQCGTY